MVQRLHGHSRVEALPAEGHVEVRAADELQAAFGELLGKGLEHAGREVDARHARRRVQLEVLLELEARAAPEIEHAASRLGRQERGGEGVELARGVDACELMLVVDVETPVEELVHSFKHGSS